MMGYFVRAQLFQHLDIKYHIMLYMFEYRYPWLKLASLKQEVEFQSIVIGQINNTVK